MNPKNLSTALATAFLSSLLSTHAATVLWVGLGSSDNFNDSANWDPAVALDAGNTITFGGSTRLTPNNNVTLTSADNAITFATGAGAFTLTGNAIRMGNLVNNSSNLQTVNVSLRYNGSRNIDTGAAGVTLLQQPLSTGGARTVTKLGAGLLTVQGSGGTNINYTVNAGSMRANTTISGSITVNNAAVLEGTGTINGAVTIGSTAFLSPGNSIGTLNLGSSGATLNGTLLVEYSGATIDLLNVTGGLNITNATVDFDMIGSALSEPSYVFATYGSLTGTQFATVSNLPVNYEIDYAFGGNNIALVLIPEPSTALLGGLGLLALLRRRR